MEEAKASKDKESEIFIKSKSMKEKYVKPELHVEKIELDLCLLGGSKVDIGGGTSNNFNEADIREIFEDTDNGSLW